MLVFKGLTSILLISIAFGISFHFYRKNDLSKALIFILFGGLFLRFFCIGDAFLQDWDEQFHALVAKNFMKHWLKPTLFDTPLLPYDFQNWSMNHIWLSKQPLPLWCMAFSMKIFGVNLWALRLPSLIISTISIWVTYKISYLLFNNRIALYAAFLNAIHGLTFEVATGRDSSDHVQCFFDFFISLGVLTALLAYKRPRKNQYSFLSGACMGCAFMCKWYPALLIFPIWLLFNWRNQGFLRNMLVFWLASLLIALPWQVYILTHYPVEANWMFMATLIPARETIQGHSGEWWYYLNDIRIIFGEIIYIPMLWLCAVAFKKINKIHIQFLLLWIGLPTLIFSMSATKRQPYLLIMAPAFFILTAYFAEYLRRNRLKMRFNQKFLSLILFLLIALPIRYALERLKPFHYDKINTEKTVWLKNIDEKTGGEGAVLFNMGSDFIRAMFFSNVTASYPSIPTTQQIEDLNQKGHKIFIVKNDNVPASLLNRTDVKFFSPLQYY
jgi:4-amino-4-deoxy-L-arabinose transferase-like glycosyltransferase